MGTLHSLHERRERAAERGSLFVAVMEAFAASQVAYVRALSGDKEAIAEFTRLYKVHDELATRWRAIYGTPKGDA